MPMKLTMLISKTDDKQPNQFHGLRHNCQKQDDPDFWGRVADLSSFKSSEASSLIWTDQPKYE